MLKHIRTLHLSGCSRLDKLPENLGEMEGLGELFADGTAMKELPLSIEQLTSLVLINLRNCKSLMSLPETICQLKCLKTLILSGCSKLDKLPENFGDMECLEELHVDGTAIMRPPSSFGRLKNLKVLSFCKFEEETHQSKSSLFLSWILPIKYHDFIRLVLPSLSGLSLSTKLKLSGCNMIEAALPNDLGNLSSLEVLNLSGWNFVNLPESINGLSRLEILKLVGCKNLEALPKLPSNIVQLYADECHSLKSIPDLSMNDKLVVVSFVKCLNLLQNKQSENMADMLLQCMLQALLNFQSVYSIFRRQWISQSGYGIFLPGTQIPQWFSHKNLGPSVSIQLPPGWFCKKLTGVALCIVCEFTVLGGIWVNFNFRNRGDWSAYANIVFRRWIPNKKINSAYLFLSCVLIEELDAPCFYCKVGPNALTLEVNVAENPSYFYPCNMFQVKEIGIRLVYKEDTDTDSDITDWFNEPCKNCEMVAKFRDTWMRKLESYVEDVDADNTEDDSDHDSHVEDMEADSSEEDDSHVKEMNTNSCDRFDDISKQGRRRGLDMDRMVTGHNLM
ncbi:hypothetical protein F0562_030698 [Nyssa sinensis]|uniref:Uncharacterized protein n=1 Tax=Nyssa sinensis TaxID=561372 RepID=A0A5J5AX49_9ASTE|nr:hypothetical protein F0562_030698 [Nyssa sinensis]